MQTLKRGMLISLEGIDGSGKSTLANNLSATLQNQNYPVLLTKEPGDSELGKKIRPILQEKNVPVCDKAEYLLFASDRAQHFHEIVIPALHEKKIVISDRMADSSVVYQGYGRGLDIDTIKTVNAWAMNGIKPDLTIYITIPLEVAVKRWHQRNEELSSFEKEKSEFMEKIIHGFDTLFANRDDVILVDGQEKPEILTVKTMHAVLAWLITNNCL